MTIYTLANWATGFIEAYLLFVLCETFLERRGGISRVIIAAAALLTGVAINIINNLFSITVLNSVLVILAELAATFIYTGRIRTHIITAVLNYTVTIVTEVSVLAVMTLVFRVSAGEIIAEGQMRLLGILLSKIFCYAVIKFIHMRFGRGMAGHDAGYWILFLTMFAVSAFTMFTFCKMLEENVNVYVRNLAVISSIGVSAATVITLLLYENTMKQSHQLHMDRLSEVRLKEQISHYDDIMMTQGQVKKLNHDLKNHLLSLMAMIKREEYGEGEEYIKSLLQSVNTDGLYTDTGNTVLDAIISAKKAAAQRGGIQFDADIKIPSSLPVASEDICVIFGNALDNAIEAASKSEEKYINLSLAFDKETLVCRISNSYIGDASAVTTKGDIINHGIGRESIKNALTKYNSVSKVIADGHEYTLMIIIMGLKL